MTMSPATWRRWRDARPTSGDRILVRTPSYSGEVHVVEDRLRTYATPQGYGRDLNLDEDAEWMPVIEDGLPTRFSVD